MLFLGLLCMSFNKRRPKPIELDLIESTLFSTERLHFHFSLSCIGETNGNPLQCSCLENPRDGGAWWAATYGVAQGQTQLKRLSSSSSTLFGTSSAAAMLNYFSYLCLGKYFLASLTLSTLVLLPQMALLHFPAHLSFKACLSVKLFLTFQDKEATPSFCEESTMHLSHWSVFICSNTFSSPDYEYFVGKS